MRKLNKTRFQRELAKAPEYTPPEKDRGYGYLYGRLYLPFVRGQEIPLGTLDFDAFSSGDVQELAEDFYGRFSRQLSRNNGIKSGLRKAEPIPSAVPFL